MDIRISMEIFEILSYPFVQRSIIAGVLASLVCAAIGMLTVLRGSALYGDALAHASLAGVATALLFGFNPLLGALAYALIVSLVLTHVNTRYKLSLDNLIALVLPVSMGLAVILLSFFSGYQPELISFLFGSLLAVSWMDIIILGIVSLLVLAVYFYKRKELFFVYFDEEYAHISGINVQLVNTIYNILLAFTVVTAIKIVGVILVNALLVIPTSIVRLHAKSMKTMLLATPIISIAVTLIGIAASFILNIPTGPAIAVTAGVLFILSLGIKRLRKV